MSALYVVDRRHSGEEADLLPLIQVVVRACVSPATRETYRLALIQFDNWLKVNRHGFTGDAVKEYKSKMIDSGYSASSINVALAAIRKLAMQAAERRAVDPALPDILARIEGVKNLGIRSGNWLDLETTKRLLELPDRTTLAGKRDSALLALLFGGALRRSEACALNVAHLQVREGRTAIVDMVGKGRRVRTVPLPGWASAAVQEWLTAAGITSGRVLRQVYGERQGHMLGERLGADGLWKIVQGYSERLGVRFSPHDARRTAATLAYKGGARERSIQAMLGHSSVQTTEKYLAGLLVMEDPAGDRTGI